MMLSQGSSQPLPKRKRDRPQISCTECRRRKQKCHMREDGPCTNCLRRYPPVECYVQKYRDDPKPPPRAVNTLPPIVNSRNWLPHINNNGSSSSGSSTTSSSQPSSAPEQPRVRYSSIPLSHILHPQNEEVIPPTYVADSPHYVNPSPDPSSHTIDGREEAVEEENVEQIIPECQNLKYMDPGMKEVMYKRIQIGGSPRTIGGMLDVLNTFNQFPVKTSLRNAELFTFYRQYVGPRLNTVDGSDIHPLFSREILPWQIRSTLMPNVAILMAAATQGYLQNPSAEMSSEALIIKEHVLRLVSRFICQDFNLIGNEAMRIVIHLVLIEWWWGSPDALWFHMDGICRMVQLRGGLRAIEDPMNMAILIITDYQLACCYETDLRLQTVEQAISSDFMVRSTYPARFRCPLVEYSSTFEECYSELSLDIKIAQVLDGIRWLTGLITSSMLKPEQVPIESSVIIEYAKWLYGQILPQLASSLHSENQTYQQAIEHTVLVTSLVHAHCIATTTAFTQAFSSLSHISSTLFDTLMTDILLVPLSIWAKIPGIFLFVLLVATPASEDDYRGKFLRKQQACTGTNISLEDFSLGTVVVRNFWAVQLWIRRTRGEGCGDECRSIGT